MTKQITVIMPSLLLEYSGAATDRVTKFHRAVNSFLKQDYLNKKLIIISDGCEYTNIEYYNHYASKSDIILIQHAKEAEFSGNIRQQGLNHAANESIICYLDSDDYFGSNNHLSNIVSVFNKNESLAWFYMNDYYGDGIVLDGVKKTKIEHGCIGTSSIAHLNKSNIKWIDCDGYGHDFLFIKQMYNLYPNPIKENVGNYRICHIPKLFDI